MESCVIYHMNPDEVQSAFSLWNVRLKDEELNQILSNSLLAEVWSMLPVEHKFVEVEARGGQTTLRHKSASAYIYVWPGTLDEQGNLPRKPLLALCYRETGEGKLKCISISELDITDSKALIQHAKVLNRYWVQGTPLADKYRHEWEAKRGLRRTRGVKQRSKLA